MFFKNKESMKYIFIFVLSLIYIFNQRLSAQTDDLKTRELNNVLNNLINLQIKHHNSNNENLKGSLNSLNSEMSKLINLINVNSVTPEYLSSLDYYNRVFKNIDTLNTDSIKIIMLNELYEDVKLKLSRDSGFHSTNYLTVSVKVQIRVLNQDGTENNSGVKVKCNFYCDGITEPPRLPFDGNVNPYLKDLTPGHYKIWVTKNQEKLIDDEMEISGEASQVKTFILP